MKYSDIYMIQIQQLSKHYDMNVVLQLPELHIGAGECIGLVGNNGAGKTTLFSLILDLIRATTGSVKIGGHEVASSEDWKQITTAYIDESFLIGYLTPEEYFYFIGELRGIHRSEIDAFVAQFEELFNGEVLNTKKYLRDFSKGNQKKVGLIATLIGQPKLIIWDEPFANLDPTTQIRLKNLLRRLTADKTITFLISSHDLSHTVEVSDRILVLEKGKLVKDTPCSPETLQELEAFFHV